MRLKDLKEHDEQLDEILPAIGAIAGGAARVAGGAMSRGLTKAGGALARGVSSAGGALVRGVKSAATTVGQKVAGAAGQAASGLAGGGMDPAQAAAEKKQHDDDKRSIQAAIKEKQAEIAELQKQLASIG
jgi:hypothetical protein